MWRFPATGIAVLMASTGLAEAQYGLIGAPPSLFASSQPNPAAAYHAGYVSPAAGNTPGYGTVSSPLHRYVGNPMPDHRYGYGSHLSAQGGYAAAGGYPPAGSISPKGHVGSNTSISGNAYGGFSSPGGTAAPPAGYSLPTPAPSLGPAQASAGGAIVGSIQPIPDGFSGLERGGSSADCGSGCSDASYGSGASWLGIGRRLSGTCDMVMHYAYYPPMHGYYYFHPYHHSHVPMHQAFVTQLGGMGVDMRNPYSNDFFKLVYAQYRASQTGNVPEVVPLPLIHE